MKKVKRPALERLITLFRAIKSVSGAEARIVEVSPTVFSVVAPFKKGQYKLICKLMMHFNDLFINFPYESIGVHLHKNFDPISSKEQTDGEIRITKLAVITTSNADLVKKRLARRDTLKTKLEFKPKEDGFMLG